MNSHLLPLFISYRSSGEKLIKYQANSSCVIMSVILTTTLFYKSLILHGEIWCWSLGVLFYYVWRIKYLLTFFFFVDIFDAPKLSQLCASWRCQRIWKVSSPSFKSSKSLHVCQNCCILYLLFVIFNSSLTWLCWFQIRQIIYLPMLREHVNWKKLIVSE